MARIYDRMNKVWVIQCPSCVRMTEELVKRMREMFGDIHGGESMCGKCVREEE